MIVFVKRVVRRVRSDARRLARYRLVLTGRPLVLWTRRHVLKVVLRGAAARHLAREVATTQLATTWAPFTGMVVEQELVTRFVARSDRRYGDGSRDDTVAAMVRFVERHTAMVGEARRETAFDLLRAHMERLRVAPQHRHALFERFCAVLESDFFAFEVPRTPMHGDFAPENAILRGDDLVLVDWEYASERGSLLYDVWFLRRCIGRDRAQLRAAEALLGRLDRVVATLTAQLGLDDTQFDAFGHAMHALVDFSRTDTRGEGDHVLAFSVGEIERLAVTGVARREAPMARCGTRHD